MPPPLPLRFAQGYDRWLDKRGPLAAAMRFAMSVPGQILVNTAAFTLPEELRMRPDWRVLDMGCGRAGIARVLAERARLQQAPIGLDASRRMLSLARRDIESEGGPPVCLAQGLATALPFLLPPIPRVSFLMGKAPEGWKRAVTQGRTGLQHAPERS